jgi:hypothetical protein
MNVPFPFPFSEENRKNKKDNSWPFRASSKYETEIGKLKLSTILLE